MTTTVNIPKTMKACLYYGPSDIRLEEVLIPRLKHSEILVKIEASLTSGSSYKTYKRGHPVLINKELPSPFGHQFSGSIVDVGSNIKDFSIGDRVIAVNTAPCYECFYCKKERFSLCENLFFLNGAYAEYIVIPERIAKNNTYKIPEGINFKIAAMTETLAVVLHGIEKSEIDIDQTVAVIGTGPVGLLFIRLLKDIGLKEIISIGRNEKKLEIAKEAGANYIIKNLGNPLIKDEVFRITKNKGADIVIEAAGNPETWELSLNIVGKGGTVNFFGGCKPGSKIEVDTYRLHYEELKLIGTFHHSPKYVKKAIESLQKKEIQELINKKIITHTLPLEKLKEAFLLHEIGEAVQVAIE